MPSEMTMVRDFKDFDKFAYSDIRWAATRTAWGKEQLRERFILDTQGPFAPRVLPKEDMADLWHGTRPNTAERFTREYLDWDGLYSKGVQHKNHGTGPNWVNFCVFASYHHPKSRIAGMLIMGFSINLNKIISPYPVDDDWLTFLAENLTVRPPRTELEIEMHGVVRTGKGNEWLRAVQKANIGRSNKWMKTGELKKLIAAKGAEADSDMRLAPPRSVRGGEPQQPPAPSPQINMGFHHHHEEADAQAHSEVYNTQPSDEHKANGATRYELVLIGGAAAFAAAKAYEKKQEKDGKPVSHGTAKALIAGIAAAEVDKLFESKGLDFIDKEKAKHHAKKEAEKIVKEDNY
ncbi:hypothetical protein RQP46_003594 [Phenoliferia psychrophenolica]